VYSTGTAARKAGYARPEWRQPSRLRPALGKARCRSSPKEVSRPRRRAVRRGPPARTTSLTRQDVAILKARAHNWRLETGGVTKWGESSKANYAAYLEFLVQWGVLKAKIDVNDLITLDLIQDINAFTPADIAVLAKLYPGD
jgi:hypothetical protein